MRQTHGTRTDALNGTNYNAPLKLHVLMPYCMASDKRRDTVAYWEARLTRMGLSAERGRHDWLSYGHVSSDLDFDGRRTYNATVTGDEDVKEWPISL